LATSAASRSFMIFEVSKFSQSPKSEPILDEDCVLSLRNCLVFAPPGVGDGGSDCAK